MVSHEERSSTMERLPMEASTSSESQVGLRSVSFLGLLGMQFLTATNDNIFRWLVVGIGKRYVDRKSTRLNSSH